MTIYRIYDDLVGQLERLRFAPPVSHVYNPLVYAAETHRAYLGRYGRPPREVLLVGMNPGPFGMAQTGVPFGEIGAVRDWLEITGPVGTPERVHPKRPVSGFDCEKSEVSGRRLWGWARKRFETPDRFFRRFFVINYCPLMFMESSGRNRTPDRLPKAEKLPLMAACDRALQEVIRFYSPAWVIGVGNFAAGRIESALRDTGVRSGKITHPSPANPRANRGWAERVEGELAELGIGPLG